jgi:hypothetical protein
MILLSLFNDDKRSMSMSLESHIESLNEKVNDLEGKIHEAYVHHLPTQELKRKRVHLMDAIRQLLQEYNKKQAA